MGLILGHRNHADAATLSDGSWDANFPRDNMKSLPIKKPARTISLNANTSYILFKADIGTGKVVDLFGLFGFSIPDGSQITVIGSDGATITPPHKYNTTVGSPTYVGPKEPSFVIPIPGISARYWYVQIQMPTAGTIDIGRLFIGEAWKPENGHDFGGTSGIESTTLVQSSLSGVDFFDRRPNKRTKQVKFSWLSEVEAYQGALEIQRRLDVSGEVVVADDDLIKPDLCGGQWATTGTMWTAEGSTVTTETIGSLWTPNGRTAPSVLTVTNSALTLHGLTAQPFVRAGKHQLTILCAVRRRSHDLYCALRLSMSSHFESAATTRVVFKYSDGSIGSQFVDSGLALVNKFSKKLPGEWYLIGMTVNAANRSTNYKIYASLNLMEAADGTDVYTAAVPTHSIYYSGLSVFEGTRTALYPGIEQMETYLARMRQLGPLENPYVDTHSTVFDLVEVV